MTLAKAALKEAREIRDRLLSLEHEAERAHADFRDAVRRLHAAGGSTREIGEALAMSHQRVHQIVGAGGKKGRPRGLLGRARRGVGEAFERFTKDARQTMVLAQEEARALGHDYVGTEHLALGVLAGDGATARVLGSLGVTLAAARSEVRELVGEGPGAHTGAVPFTPRSKRSLELALRVARERGDGYIGSEHILLAIVREPEGVGAQVLARLGADEPAVRRALA